MYIGRRYPRTDVRCGRWICLICIPQVHLVPFVTVFRLYNATNVAIIPVVHPSKVPYHLLIGSSTSIYSSNNAPFLDSLVWCHSIDLNPILPGHI